MATPQYGVTLNGDILSTATKRFRIIDHIQKSAELKCSVRHRAGQTRPQRGDTVRVYNGGTNIFTGTVINCKDKYDLKGKATCELIAYDRYRNFQRVVVPKNYDGSSLKEILEDIVPRVPGVTLSSSQADGPTFDNIRSDYRSAYEFINTLVDITRLLGDMYVPHMLPDNTFRMINLNELDAPADLTDASGIDVGPIIFEHDLSQYHNEVTVTSQPANSDPITYEFSGDGTSRTFALPRIVGAVDSVTVNGTAQAVAEEDSDTAADAVWTYRRFGNQLTQKDSETVLDSTDDVEVTYRTVTPVVSTSSDTAEKASMGTHARGVRIDGITGEEARQAADAALERSNLVRTVIHFQTFTVGFKPGHRISVNRTLPSVAGDVLVDGTFIVEHVEYTDFSSREDDFALKCFVAATAV